MLTWSVNCEESRGKPDYFYSSVSVTKDTIIVYLKGVDRVSRTVTRVKK